mgnify:CR=1 FL=1
MARLLVERLTGERTALAHIRSSKSPRAGTLIQLSERAGDGPALVIDGHKTGAGPSSMDLVLMGVAGCTATDVILVMEKKRVNVTGFEINISGERADDHPRRYTHIHIESVLTGTGIRERCVL